MKGFKLILLVLMTASFSANTTHGQSKVPGYMGKRFIAGYKFHFMPGWGGSPGKNAEFTQSSENTFKFNTFNEVYMEYVVGRKTSLVGSSRFAKAQFDPTAVDWTGSFSGVSNEYGQMSYAGGGLGIRFYRKHLAPLASYIGVNAGYLAMSTEPYTYFSDFSGVTNIRSTTGGTPYIGFEFGTNKILYDHLVLSFNLEGTFILAFLYNATLDELSTDFSDPDDESNETAIRTEAFWRMQQQQFLNFSIGIGFLP